MKTLDELLRERLQQPVRDKQGNIITNKDTGQDMTAEEAMVMAIVNEAMKGSVQHFAFIRNITAVRNSTADESYRNRQQMRVCHIADRLREQLTAEHLYDGQDTEITNLAETQYLVELLSEQLHAQDFQCTTTEYRANGSTQTVVNPLIALLDAQKERFSKQLDKLRDDALQRNLNKKRM